MMITTADDYRRAIAELHRLRQANPDDTQRTRDLEAAIEAFAQTEADRPARPGRPAGSIPTP